MAYSAGNGSPGETIVNFPRFRGLKQSFDDIPGRGLRLGLIALLVAILAFTTLYTVEPEEVGVVQRFGAYVRTTSPGLNLKLPFGVEQVTKVPVERQLKLEFGFRTREPGVRTVFESGGFEGESNMLTGDLNAAVVEWVVQYRVIDPYNYLFRVRNLDETLRDMSEAVMREVVGNRTVNEVLTVGRTEIAAQVEEKLQVLADQYETGLHIDQVVLQDVNPPSEVKASFNEVNEAEQEQDRLRNEAQAAYNEVVPRAEGEALQAIQSAEGYALDRVNRARGEASRFGSLFTEYEKAPEVTRRRIYLETLSRVLPRAGAKTVIDDDLSNLVPLLNVGAVEGARRSRAGQEGDG